MKNTQGSNKKTPTTEKDSKVRLVNNNFLRGLFSKNDEKAEPAAASKPASTKKEQPKVEKPIVYSTLSIFHLQSLIYLSNHKLSKDMGGMQSFLLLLILDHDEISAEEILLLTHLSPNIIRRYARKLRDKGFIEITREDDDVIMTATELGREQQPILYQIGQEYEQVMTKNMTKEQLAVLRSLVEKATENLVHYNRED